MQNSLLHYAFLLDQWMFKRIALQGIHFRTMWNAFCHFDTVQCCSLFVLSYSQFSLWWSGSKVGILKITFPQRGMRILTPNFSGYIFIMLDWVLQACFNVIGEDGTFEIPMWESDKSVSSSVYFAHLAIKGVHMFDMLVPTRWPMPWKYSEVSHFIPSGRPHAQHLIYQVCHRQPRAFHALLGCHG